MPSKLLLPHKLKKTGWILLLLSVVLGTIQIITNYKAIPINARVFAIVYDEILTSTQYFSLVDTNITPTLTGMLFIAGGLLVGFTKEKTEDEYIAALRQSSLLWAVLINYILLFFSLAFIYGIVFLNIMLYNMFTILIIYIARFNYILFRNAKAIPNEEHH